MKIGLLGGSFNPAHEGHYHISIEALKRLKLDAVWWLVSPQNPLKSTGDMAGYAQRVASAEHFCQKHPALSICEIEQQNGLKYTAETLQFIQETHPHHQFIWLMGSDNLAQLHRWKEWHNIMNYIPICIIDRAPHSHASLRSKAALAYQQHRVSPTQLAKKGAIKTPQWSYLFIPRHNESATRLRNEVGDKAFLG